MRAHAQKLLQGIERSPVLLSLLWSLPLLLALQLWRPYFFLTDDNLSHMPWIVEVGRHLAHGEYPFISSYLGGGGYPYLKDPMFLSYCHPAILLLSLLANTSAVYLIPDLIAIMHLLVCAGLFALLACRLRDQYNPTLENHWIVFLSLSYTFSGYAVIVGASWEFYLGNQAAMPMFLLGLLEKRRVPSILWIAAGVVQSILAGHVGAALFSIPIVTLTSLGICFIEKSPRALLSWIAGGILAAALTFYFWSPTVLAFGESERNLAYSLTALHAFGTTVILLFSSFFLGVGSLIFPAAGLTDPWGKIFGLNDCLSFTLGCCAAAWLVITTAPSWRKVPALAWVCLLCLIPAILVIVQPDWFLILLQKLPLYRSLRWPIKQIFIFLFYIHLWLVLVPFAFTRKTQRVLAFAGTTILLISLFPFPPPSFYPMETDRQCLLSGSAQKFWSELKREGLQPGDIIVPVVSPNIGPRSNGKDAMCLIGSGNYGAQFEAPSLGTYSVTQPPEFYSLIKDSFNVRGELRPEADRSTLPFPDRLVFLTLIHIDEAPATKGVIRRYTLELSGKNRQNKTFTIGVPIQ